jgi:DNA-binding MarR family transcriptional regulator
MDIWPEGVGGYMTAEKQRNDAGQYVTTRSPDAVLDAMEPLEPYTSGELAEMLGWPRRTVYQVLDGLADEGAIRKKKPEERRVIWMLLEDES